MACFAVTTHARQIKNCKTKAINRTICHEQWFLLTFPGGLWQLISQQSASLWFLLCTFPQDRRLIWWPNFLSARFSLPPSRKEWERIRFRSHTTGQTEARNRYVMESAERPSLVFRLNSASVCFGNGQPALCMHVYPLTHTCSSQLPSAFVWWCAKKCARGCFPHSAGLLLLSLSMDWVVVSREDEGVVGGRRPILHRCSCFIDSNTHSVTTAAAATHYLNAAIASFVFAVAACVH